jgi:hypothetical protein
VPWQRVTSPTVRLRSRPVAPVSVEHDEAFRHFSSTGNTNGARGRRDSLILLVGGTGIEPVTPAV